LKRIIIDAGVLLSSLTGRPDAPPAILLHAVYHRVIAAIACPLVIAEAAKNLRENHYFSDRITPDDALKALTRIENAMIMHPNPSNIQQTLRDPKDNYLLALAHTTKAAYIVTGDNDLLEHIDLQPPAVNPRNACELLKLITLH